MPLVIDPANRQNRGSHFLYLIGRLADGATLASAQGRARDAARGWPSTVAAAGRRQLRAAHAGHQEPPASLRRAAAADRRRRADRGVRPAGRRGVRAADRVREPRQPAARARRVAAQGVRGARGARRGRARLLRQFMVEGCLLSLSGAALGLGVAVARRARADRRVSRQPAAIGRRHLDAGVLAFTLVIGLLTGAVFGLAPLLHLVGRRDVDGAEGRRHANHGRSRTQPDPPRRWSPPKWRSRWRSSSAPACCCAR